MCGLFELIFLPIDFLMKNNYEKIIEWKNEKTLDEWMNVKNIQWIQEWTNETLDKWMDE